MGVPDIRISGYHGYHGVRHHIMIRGIERRKIFINDRDRQDFLDRLWNWGGNTLHGQASAKSTGKESFLLLGRHCINRFYSNSIFCISYRYCMDMAHSYRLSVCSF